METINDDIEKTSNDRTEQKDAHVPVVFHCDHCSIRLASPYVEKQKTPRGRFCFREKSLNFTHYGHEFPETDADVVVATPVLSTQ